MGKNKGASKGGVRAYILEIINDPVISRQLAHHRILPESSPEYSQCRQAWPGAITKLMSESGIRLFSHQAMAMDYIRAGKSIIASTPTASGKSLIYNLPVYERFLSDPDARALYLFPLKALAQDQLNAFFKLGQTWPKDARPTAALYDGDTSDWERRKIRKNPPVAVLTNPEMLHLSLLPYNESWSTFLANLAFIIVDEAHTYRGIFGCHMAQVFRRLNRICARYGANPVYIFCSATLGNPLELAQNLSGKEDIQLIDKSGAPQGIRHYLFMDPEKSAASCAIDLLKRALARDLRVIVYCQSRKMAELVSIWAASESGEWQDKISAYRAGFLPEERRDIEARMASGDLRAVISTSALELGIDIGGLDLCILLGYPGTIMQTLQRGGRVGRSQQEAAVIVVAGEDALDQYFIRHPEDFFTRSPEKAVLNPLNQTILERHLECAATEMRLNAEEDWLAIPDVSKAVKSLEDKNLLVPALDGKEWAARHKRPHGRIDLRGSGQNYSIEDKNGRIIGAIDGYRAWKESHPGAIYLHLGKNYLVDSLDDGSMRILVREAQTDWHTRSRANKSTEIMELAESRKLGGCLLCRGRLKITEKVTAFEKRANSGNRLLTVTALDAPPHIFETEGMWLTIPDRIRLALEKEFLHYMGSIHALEHALIGLIPLEIMADRNDLGGISIPLHHQLGVSAIFVYDALPGGAGLSTSAYREAEKILKATWRAITDCPCEEGCPSCIQSPKCGAGNRPLSKLGSIRLLEEIFKPDDRSGIIDEAILSLVPATQELQILPCPDSIPEDGRACKRETHFLVFDVETRRSAQEVGGWHNADMMGVSVAVCYDSYTDTYHVYNQDELGELFSRMLKTDLLVGFNSRAFDYQVLQPFWEQWSLGQPGKPDLYSLPYLDIFKYLRDKTNLRISLDNLGSSTLKSPKSANGLQALKWWKEGRLDMIGEYCRRDVEITKNLYLHGLEHKYLFYTNKAGMLVKCEVKFD